MLEIQVWYGLRVSDLKCKDLGFSSSPFEAVKSINTDIFNSDSAPKCFKNFSTALYSNCFIDKYAPGMPKPSVLRL
jgi:hypothetical protein